MKDFIARLKDTIETAISTVVDDVKRREVMFLWVNRILAVVSFVMSVINIFTREYALLISTLVFSALCIVNLLLSHTRIKKWIIILIFGIEALALLTFFFVSGIPDGFSALWICLIPSFALFIFGTKNGSILCAAALGMMIFLFWLPFGKSLLMYDYNPTFMLRFPFLYIAIYLISLLVEYVRSETRKKLVDAETKYKNLSKHDELTGLFNRYGFNEIIKNIFEQPTNNRIAAMLMDFDDFKRINDVYGHSAGDEVLKSVATILKQLLCEHCKYCRWGGEEFLVIMQCEHDPVELAEKIKTAVQDLTVKYGDAELKITLSIGVFIADDMSTTSITQLVNQADKCLYEAKANGKNQVKAIHNS